MSAYKPHLQRTCLHNYGNSTIPENMQPVLIGSQFFTSISYYMLADTSHRRHFLLLRTSRHQLEDIKYKKTLPPPFASLKKPPFLLWTAGRLPPFPRQLHPETYCPNIPCEGTICSVLLFCPWQLILKLQFAYVCQLLQDVTLPDQCPA